MKSTILETLRTQPLVCDGAMGTQLMLAGLESGACGELWNLTHPERVLAIQKSYVEAGADCLITNTFGASRIVLSRHGAAKDVQALNQAGATLARQAFGTAEGFVFGDIGPLGAMLEPYGDLSQADAKLALEEQARALVEAGVDAIILETQTSLEELRLGIAAARSAGAACIIGSLAYDLSSDGSRFATMMGVFPEKAAAFLQENGAHIAALNCGTGMDMPGAVRVARLYRKNSSLPIMIQPNAGLPVLENGCAVYNQTPAQMAAGVAEALAAGTNIIGSCCGSSPDHTRAIRHAINKHHHS
jgi:5-methyltetrahydrofolate--homocysteine methyltransferase